MQTFVRHAILLANLVAAGVGFQLPAQISSNRAGTRKSLCNFFHCHRERNKASCTVALKMDCKDLICQASEELANAYLTQDVDGLLAAGITEAVAGSIGGLASRSVAQALGNEKRDQPLLKAASSGAFFGVRGITRTLAKLSGLPRPLQILIGSLLGSVGSLLVKFFGRYLYDQRVHGTLSWAGWVPDEKFEHSVDGIGEVLDVPEVASDVMKWLAYDLLSSQASVPPMLHSKR